MKTVTELVCLNHFGQYQHEGIDKRNSLPIDLSFLKDPVDGLCSVDKSSYDEYGYGGYHAHSKMIIAVTWKN